jgi:hypothetical protein
MFFQRRDHTVRSYLFSYDRPFCPGLDIQGELLLHHLDWHGINLERVFPLHLLCFQFSNFSTVLFVMIKSDLPLIITTLTLKHILENSNMQVMHIWMG